LFILKRGSKICKESDKKVKHPNKKRKSFFMKSKSTHEYQKNLFKVDLEWLLNPEEPLYKLSNKINWSVFEKEFGSTYSPSFIIN